MFFIILLVLSYILSWGHLIYRIRHGGKHPEFGPREYMCDERCMKADMVSCLTTVIGTIVILTFIF